MKEDRRPLERAVDSADTQGTNFMLIGTNALTVRDSFSKNHAFADVELIGFEAYRG